MAHEKRPNLVRRAAKAVTSAALIVTPAVWMGEYTNWGRTMPGKERDVSKNILLTPPQEQEVLDHLKERLVNVSEGYARRDHMQNLSPRELAYAKEGFAQYEVLEEGRGSPSTLGGTTGFHGVLFRDKASGKIILSLSGVNFEFTKDGLDDFDDMLVASAGGVVSQEKDARAFAERAMQKYGHIDYVTGHSLGAYNAMFLKGMNVCPGAEFYLFDAPGQTRTMTQHMMDLSGLSRDEVLQNLRENCYSFSQTPNSWNLRGTQVGIARTVNNDHERYTAVWPRKHTFGSGFIHDIESSKTLQPWKGDQTNGAPEMMILAFLLAATLPFAADIGRGCKRGVKSAADRWTQRREAARESGEMNAGRSA